MLKVELLMKNLTNYERANFNFSKLPKIKPFINLYQYNQPIKDNFVMN
jgi:hypothetical protein